MDGRIHDDSIYRASIASRGHNRANGWNQGRNICFIDFRKVATPRAKSAVSDSIVLKIAIFNRTACHLHWQKANSSCSRELLADIFIHLRLIVYTLSSLFTQNINARREDMHCYKYAKAHPHQQQCRMLQVKQLFFRQSRTLLRHSCWCEPGLTEAGR